MVVDLSPSSAKADAPTNPLFTNTASSTEVLTTAISKNGLSSFTPEYHDGGGTRVILFHRVDGLRNLSTTKGFRIKCYDALTQEGIQLSTSNSDFNTHNYFVMLYPHDSKKHHFARITELITEDEEGDAFEFEPKLGNEIPKGTPFRIIKGHPLTNTDIVAFSAMVKGDMSTTLSCARPNFYFFNDLLDKKNELDHNTKYYCMQEVDSLTGNIAALNSTNAVTFRTVQDFGKVVIDYSKFTHRVTLTDKLRTLDDTISGSITINEGGTITADTNDYDEMFPNARRDTDDEINTSRDYGGPIRYLHYDFSPTKSNILYNVYEHTNTESIDGKGGFSKSSIVDNGRIMSKKVKEFTSYRVRNLVHRGDLSEFFALDARFSSASSNTFTFNVGYDLKDVLNPKDEIKLGDKILIINSIAAPSGNTQEITLESSTNPYARTENEGVFTAQTVSPSSGDVLHRRAYNPIDNTLMLNSRLISGRFSKLFVAFSSLNNEGRFAEITACDGEKSMITLSFPDASYTDNTLNYLTGEYEIYLQRFDGEIENIEIKKEDGQSIMTLEGRDNFNKLLSPIVNLNTLFTEDIIYSSDSPYNKLSQIDSTTFTVALEATSLATGVAVSAFDIVPSAGDKIFTVNGYIGKILTATGDPLTITFTPAMTEVNSEKIYIDTEKNYILNKALSSSHIATNRASSLLGAANKGFIFTSGNKIDISDGTEDETLVLSSANTNPDAIGYAVNSPSSIDEDNPFQSKLKDEHGSAGVSSFDTVNTLIDFEVIRTSTKDNETIIELAPYVPITMGAYVENESLGKDVEDNPLSKFYSDVNTSGSSSDLGTAQSGSGNGSGLVKVTSTNARNVNIGDRIYTAELVTSSDNLQENYFTFLGKVVKNSEQSTSGGTAFDIYLDNSINASISGKKIYVLTKQTHDLALVNGAHLWGGKILISPHPQTVSTTGLKGLVPLNVKNTTGTKDYNNKFGQMYYKSIFTANGNFSPYKPLQASKTGIDFVQWYSANKGLMNYLSTSYRFKPNVSSNNLINFETTDSSHRVLPLHSRGNTSPYGSNVFSRIHLTEFMNLVLQDEPFVPIHFFHDIDASAARKFLYVNGDILPYSSQREDSLMHQTSGSMTKNIDNYNMFLLENKKISDKKIQEGEVVKLQDSNFQTISFTTEQDLSTLKRFSMMRLTEMCFDYLFNPINPEKPITKTYPISGSDRFYGYQVTDLGTISISGATVTTTTSVSPSSGDKIYDNKGNFIGNYSSGSGTSLTLSANGLLTDSGSAATKGYLVEEDTFQYRVLGRGKHDTIWRMAGTHHLKGAIVPEDSNYGQGSGDTIRIANDGNDVFTAEQDVFLPAVVEAANQNAQNRIGNAENFSSRVLLRMGDNKSHKGLIGVVLDRYDIEQGGKYRLVEGNTTQVFTNVDAVLVEEDYTDASNTDEHTHFVLETTADYGYKNYESPSISTASDPSASGDSTKAADGAFIVFKPRLWVSSSNRTQDTTTTKSSNGTLIKNEFDISSSNSWLKHVDLTGCYLASENGEDEDFLSTSSGTEFLRKASKGLRPTTLTYIISHEVDETDTTIHHIITDKTLTNDIAYRPLQPNEVCFYDFMPKTFYLNTLMPQYTKLANKNEVYDIKSGYFHREGIDRSASNDKLDEGIRSMFVILDTDRQTTETDLVVRDGDDFISEYLTDNNYSFYITDGENGVKTNVEISDLSGIGKITFDKMTFKKGVVSVSETFTVRSKEELKINPDRACIGSTVQLGLEGEDLINELLEQEAIEFELPSTTDTPIFLAPNYQGVDLYSALRFILERKDMKLIEENGVFKVKQNNANEHYTDITIDDSGDYFIFEFEKVSTVFDFHNEVIVYGSSHKAIRKDIRSIQKRGRKTLEVVDNTLGTKQEVEKRATALIRLHSTLNEKISIKLNNRGINQLRVGDIIHVEITRENIPMREYIVLEMEHELTGFVTLELGRYSKDLADVFSELFLSNRENKAALRSKNTDTNELGFNFLDSVNVKELKLLIRTRTASGGFKFGFGTAFNTATAPFGFSGGTITYNTLIDEDLA